MTLRRAVMLCALAAMLSPATQAAQPAQPEKTPAAKASGKAVDADLLEFLGSLDADEEGWTEFLEQKPVKAADKAPDKAPAPAKPTDTKPVKSK